MNKEWEGERARGREGEGTSCSAGSALLGPADAVHRLLGVVADGADRKGLLHLRACTHTPRRGRGFGVLGRLGSARRRQEAEAARGGKRRRRRQRRRQVSQAEAGGGEAGGEGRRARGGSHSKHFVLPLTMARTWPTYPSVPLSMSGMPTLRQSRFTCRRASTLSRAFSTMLNCAQEEALRGRLWRAASRLRWRSGRTVLKKSGPNCSVSLMLPRCASMERLAACGNARTAFLATFALDSLTSAARKRNWRLRLE